MSARLLVLLSIAADGHGWIGAWEPGLGDASWLGYFTTLLYAVATVVAARAYVHERRRFFERTTSTTDRAPSLLRAARRSADARLTLLWLVFSLILGALTLNKQLDLQTALTEAARAVAHAQGWYEHRRIVQVAFIGFLGLGAAVVSLFTIWLIRPVLRRVRITLLGGVLLVAFIAIRGASFHHLDELLGGELGGTRIHRLLELAALTCVTWGAWREGSSHHGRPAPRTS